VFGDPSAWLDDLDACATACEDAFERLRSEDCALALSRLERDLVLAAAVTRTACGATEFGAYEGEALSTLLVLAAEISERAAVSLAATGDEPLQTCREACLVAAAAARQLAPRQLSNGY
jgi:hypothetical protein